MLPGVGHFQATSLLLELGLTDAVRESVAKGAWFLGICVGLQWLFEGSTEAPGIAGLGHFKGMCERFPALFDGVELKSPHVGWNSLEKVRDGFEIDARGREWWVCLLHAFLASSGDSCNSGGYRIWWSVHGGGREGQCDGGAVSSGEVERGGITGFEELFGVVNYAIHV